MTIRTSEEIGECSDIIQEEGSKFPGMSYKEGVKAALEWVESITDIKLI